MRAAEWQQTHPASDEPLLLDKGGPLSLLLLPLCDAASEHLDLLHHLQSLLLRPGEERMQLNANALQAVACRAFAAIFELCDEEQVTNSCPRW